MQELECIQKRAMWIICPGMEHQHALALTNLPSVAEYHSDICKRTFESIFNDSGHKFRKFLPPLHESKYNLRHVGSFSIPRSKTNRLNRVNTFQVIRHLTIWFNKLFEVFFNVLDITVITVLWYNSIRKFIHSIYENTSFISTGCDVFQSRIYQSIKESIQKDCGAVSMGSIATWFSLNIWLGNVNCPS